MCRQKKLLIVKTRRLNNVQVLVLARHTSNTPWGVAAVVSLKSRFWSAHELQSTWIQGVNNNKGDNYINEIPAK